MVYALVLKFHMKVNNMTNNSDFLKRLKEETDQVHKNAHELDFFKALISKKLPLKSYTGQLRVLSIIFATLEAELVKKLPQFEIFQKNGYKDKLPYLLDDLQFLTDEIDEVIKPSVQKALMMADDIIILSQTNPIALLGYLYVLEGSLMGGNVVKDLITKQYDLKDERGSSYFGCYGKNYKEQITLFKTLLNDLVKEKDEEVVIKGAIDCFSSLILAYDTLYPFEEKDLSLHVTTLNPEAGNHEITTNPKYILTSMEASKLCWNYFDYYEFRYGKRGYRYGLSDVAWIVTLVDLKTNEMLTQVDWLVKLLSIHGMPTIMMQKQLEFLHQELIKISDDKKFDKFLEAKLYLEQKDSKILDSKKAQELALNFEKGLDKVEVKDCGILIVSSIIDEINGYTDGANNLKAFLSDENTFSKEWCLHVEKSFVNIRTLLGIK